MESSVLVPAAPPSTLPAALRGEPPPRHGGPIVLLRFLRAHGMLNAKYARLALRLARLKLRWRGRLVLDGMAFVGPDVTIEIGKGAKIHLGRWSWVGHGTKIRAHEGEVRIGAKTVLGQECTISSFRHVSIGRECIVADRRRRGRAADPRAGDLQARRARGQQRVDGLRRVRAARRDHRRQRDRRHLDGRHQGRARRRGGRRRPGPGAADAAAAAPAALAIALVPARRGPRTT